MNKKIIIALVLLTAAMVTAAMVTAATMKRKTQTNKNGTTSAVGGKGVTMSGDRTVPCIGGDCFYLT